MNIINQFRDVRQTQSALNQLLAKRAEAEAASWLAAGLPPLIAEVEAELQNAEARLQQAEAEAKRAKTETEEARQHFDAEIRRPALKRLDEANEAKNVAFKHAKATKERLAELQAAYAALTAVTEPPDVTETLRSLDLRIIGD